MTRIEAAARAVAKDEDASNWDEEHADYRNGWLTRVETILAAADAAMLSDATVERAAIALARHKWPTAMGVWNSFGQGMKDDFRDQARAVLAAAVQEERA